MIHFHVESIGRFIHLSYAAQLIGALSRAFLNQTATRTIEVVNARAVSRLPLFLLTFPMVVVGLFPRTAGGPVAFGVGRAPFPGGLPGVLGVGHIPRAVSVGLLVAVGFVICFLLGHYHGLIFRPVNPSSIRFSHPIPGGYTIQGALHATPHRCIPPDGEMPAQTHGAFVKRHIPEHQSAGAVHTIP